MKLTFLYQPVRDIKESAAFYRGLGLDEAWREGDTTVAFKLPGSPVELMLDTATGESGPGGFFEVESVDKFIADRQDLNWSGEVIDMPGGRAAAFRDPSGNWIHLFDQSAAGPE
jgi:catechol 2,3-dioxygenase-like lactoylglutathione lyase family enzyme